MKNWAYLVAIPNVGQIAYAKAYFEKSGIVDPRTAKPYTAEEIKSILDAAAENVEGYRFDLPENAVLGMGGFWYDADNTVAIVSHADSLTLKENGVFVTADSTEVAVPIR